MQDTHDDSEAPTPMWTEASRAPARTNVVRQFRLDVLEGPARGRQWASGGDRCTVGSHPSNDLVLDDATVSRFHCELWLGGEGMRVRDLDSKNGTIVDGVPVIEAFVRGGTVLRLGKSLIQFRFSTEVNQLELSEARSFGRLVGHSAAMRSVFALLERAATSDATVLIEGETGTGKDLAAESIHRAGARRGRPYVVIDCGAFPANLLESELFGHEKGSFTGASQRRIGAFEQANGGTVLLDEVGELPADLQPKLLRVLESREVRRVGANTPSPVDVRIIAATNRDLRAEVNSGSFRSDLYFRLAVLKVIMPPLRARPEDIGPMVDSFLRANEVTPEVRESLLSIEFLNRLERYAWPGNARELRNFLDRCVVFKGPMLGLDDNATPAPSGPIDVSLPYEQLRRRLTCEFERKYLEALLRAFGGKVARAATIAGLDKAYLYRMMKKHGVRPS